MQSVAFRSSFDITSRTKGFLCEAQTIEALKMPHFEVGIAENAVVLCTNEFLLFGRLCFFKITNFNNVHEFILDDKGLHPGGPKRKILSRANSQKILPRSLYAKAVHRPMSETRMQRGIENSLGRGGAFCKGKSLNFIALSGEVPCVI